MNTNNFQKAYNLLNNEQKQAVDEIYGPIMVVAGPGTGKTQIMALRAANIILKTGVDPRNILITTFTEAGIISLKKRLFDFIGTDSYKINVSTIHSFCNDVISLFPEKFLEYRAFNTIDDIEQIEILENIIEDGKFEFLSSEYDKFHYLKSIKDSISKLKNEGIGIEDFSKIIEKEKHSLSLELDEINEKLKKYQTTKEKNEKQIGKLLELAQIYEKYLAILKERGLYDFSDMINFVLQKFKTDKSLRVYFSEQYQFILVDEYQDTNNAQNEIIDLILGESDDKNIMVVGDDDQSIYRFAGANLENMLYFSKKYEDTKFIVLKHNYRSVQDILDLASLSIKNNKSRITNFIPNLSKELISNKKENISPKLYIALNDIEEKAFILEKIRFLINEGNDIENIAIIVRTNSEVESFSNFLQTNRIPVESKLKSNILKSKFVRLLLDLVQVITDPYIDDSRLANILRSSISGVNNLDVLITLRKLYNLNYSLKDKKKLFELLSSSEFLANNSAEENLQQNLFEIKNNGINSEDVGIAGLQSLQEMKIKNPELIIEFVNKLTECQKELDSNFYNFFKLVLEKFEFIEFVQKNGNFSDIEDIFTLFNYVKNQVSLDNNLKSENFFKKIKYFEKYNLVMPRNILKSSTSGVQVLTAHQSKGLEYTTVFMPSLNLGNWGSRRVIEKIKLPFSIIGSSLTENIIKEDQKDKDNEEERRLFFVSLTRAKNNLFLSYPAGVDNKPKLASEFLQEINLIPEQINNISLENVVINEMKNINFDSNFNKEEELYIREFLKTYKLSATDLNKFLEDPKLFLRDVIFKYPFEDNEFTIFGRIYHKTLEYFYLDFKKNGVLPDKSYLARSFSSLLKKEILSQEIREKMKEKGLIGLDGWYESQKEFRLPVELEYNFRPRNIVFENIPLTGKIDKIEALDENRVVLVDYKTGKIKSLNEIKGENANQDKKYFRQLLFYKIMFDLDLNLSSKYSANNFAIEFVEGKDSKYQTVNIDYTLEDLEDVKNEIKEARNKINDMDFWRGIVN